MEYVLYFITGGGVLVTFVIQAFAFTGAPFNKAAIRWRVGTFLVWCAVMAAADVIVLTINYCEGYCFGDISTSAAIAMLAINAINGGVAWLVMRGIPRLAQRDA